MNQKQELKIAAENLKQSYKGIEQDLKVAEQDLKVALKEAEQLVLSQAREEVKKVFSSAEVKAKIEPIIKKILPGILHHIKKTFFTSEVQAKINQRQEIFPKDYKREIRQSVLFNYWSLKKFKNYCQLTEIYNSQVKRLIEEDKNLTNRSRDSLVSQLKKAERLLGKE